MENTCSWCNEDTSSVSHRCDLCGRRNHVFCGIVMDEGFGGSVRCADCHAKVQQPSSHGVAGAVGQPVGDSRPVEVPPAGAMPPKKPAPKQRKQRNPKEQVDSRPFGNNQRHTMRQAMNQAERSKQPLKLEDLQKKKDCFRQTSMERMVKLHAMVSAEIKKDQARSKIRATLVKENRLPAEKVIAAIAHQAHQREWASMALEDAVAHVIRREEQREKTRDEALKLEARLKEATKKLNEASDKAESAEAVAEAEKERRKGLDAKIAALTCQLKTRSEELKQLNKKQDEEKSQVTRRLIEQRVKALEEQLTQAAEQRKSFERKMKLETFKHTEELSTRAQEVEQFKAALLTKHRELQENESQRDQLQAELESKSKVYTTLCLCQRGEKAFRQALDSVKHVVGYVAPGRRPSLDEVQKLLVGWYQQVEKDMFTLGRISANLPRWRQDRNNISHYLHPDQVQHAAFHTFTADVLKDLDYVVARIVADYPRGRT